MKEAPSTEYLQAFIDGELTREERERVLALLASDPEFKAGACELRTLKEMVRGAYGEVPPAPARSGGGLARSGLGRAVAAGLFLALGLGGGWLARDRLGTGVGFDRLPTLPGGLQPIALSERVDPGKIILHLDSAEPGRLAGVLDTAEKLLAQGGPGARIEIVANSYGLDLLRADVTPLGPRIADMAQRHANLRFVACGQTVARLKREGVRVALLREAATVTSAINEIMTRMGQGWVYVKV